MQQSLLEDVFEEQLAAAYAAAFHKEPDDDWLTAISMRAGTRGRVATLAEAGAEVGKTRARVQQVMSRVQQHLIGVEVPQLQDIARRLVEDSPVAEPIGDRLAEVGLTRPTLTGAGLLNLIKLVGTTPRDLVGTDLVCVDDWLVEESEVSVMKSIGMARKHTSAFGMTTVEEIRQAIATPENPLHSEDIRRVLKADRAVLWAGEWLWVDKASDSLHANRLVNTARSILSVNSPQTVSSIHEGARRMWKFRRLDVLPSMPAMKEFFQRSPHFVVDGDFVSPTEPLDYHEILGDVTGTMIDVLKSAPYQVMDRQSLNEACNDAGIAAGTSSVWTTYAEWMERFAPSVWGLRGGNPNPAAVHTIRKAAEARSKAEPHRKAWAWSPDGTAIQTMDVTTSLLTSGVLSFASDVHRLIAGDVLTVSCSEQPVAIVKLGAEHSFCWGWHPVLDTLGVRKGDVLQIRVDITAHTADVVCGDENLWQAAV